MRLQGQPLCHGSTSSFRSAKHSALLEHEMQVGQMLKPPEIQYSFPFKDFMMHFQGPANRRGHLVDVERWHSLHKLVSLSIHLSGLGFPTGSLRDGDLLLVPQPWFSMGCSAQHPEPFHPSPGEAVPAFLSASGHLSHSPPS